ncbi:MAG TPA: CDP-alcohol phosphatidyltransferase family protein [Thermoanaerobaculia bacterium]|nr:CDP-alcohol phosphatidyltransferase family protein [Thermoanaerobaculia bacterium]
MAERRPLKSRDRAWAKAFAAALVRLRVRPNAISLFSIVFAGVACAGFLLSGGALNAVQRLVWLVVAAAGIQLRLLCNLLDGMVAVEGKMGSKTGEIYNDFPDRIADPLIIVPAGYAIGIPALGWAAGLLAVMTAYVRVLGGSMGVPQDFRGPMAKPHRMATLTIAAIADGIAGVYNWRGRLLFAALAIIVLGTIVTMARRAARMARELNAR